MMCSACNHLKYVVSLGTCKDVQIAEERTCGCSSHASHILPGRELRAGYADGGVDHGLQLFECCEVADSWPPGKLASCAATGHTHRPWDTFHHD